MTEDNPPTSVRLSPDQKRALDRLGVRVERSRSWLIKKAVEEYIDRHGEEEEGGARH